MAGIRQSDKLKVGNYVVMVSVTEPGFRLERIAELGYLGEHDFRTNQDTTGPIEGNVYIRPGTLELIEGERIRGEYGYVYQALRKIRARSVH